MMNINALRACVLRRELPAVCKKPRAGPVLDSVRVSVEQECKQ